jgi:ribosomal protein L34
MPRKTWRAALAAYASPSTLVLLLLGFAAGLPYMLVFSTLSVWLREAGVARETIGYASLIGLAYAFKWVWSPLLDQWRLPLLGKLGRRRSWLVLSQSLVILGLIGMGFCDPQKHLSWLIAIAVIVAFASATQDIAVDAYRLEIADDSRQAALAASYMSGYRRRPAGHGGRAVLRRRLRLHRLQLSTFSLDRHLRAVRRADDPGPVDLAVHARTARAIAHPVAGRALQLRASTGLGVRADRTAGVGSGDVHPALQHRFASVLFQGRAARPAARRPRLPARHPLYP